MARKRNSRKNRRNPQGFSWRERALISLLAVLGRIAPPRSGTVSIDAYCLMLERQIMAAGKAQMGRLGQIWVDPEMPDSWESLVGLMLLPKMGSVGEYTSAMSALDTTAAVAAAAAAGQSAEQAAASAGVSTSELEQAQTWTQNTSDWWSQTWSGDWSGGLNSFTEGWDSFWSGNFGL